MKLLEQDKRTGICLSSNREYVYLRNKNFYLSIFKIEKNIEVNCHTSFYIKENKIHIMKQPSWPLESKEQLLEKHHKLLTIFCYLSL